MIYRVKWIEKNLGISRDSLRHYEEKGLLSSYGSRNPINNYREYSEEDIQKIWSIKVLIGMGYTVNEIKEFMYNPMFDFYSSLSKKIEILEEEFHKKKEYLEFAKTIKLTGKIPTVKYAGSIKYSDFMKYAVENWNIYSDTRMSPYARITEKLISKSEEEWKLEDLEGLENTLFSFDEMTVACNVHAYYRLMAELQYMDDTSKTVQTVVRLLYEYLLENVIENKEEFTPQFFAKQIIPSFLESDIAILQEKNYGKEGCRFIANAMAYFGGLENIKKFE